MCVNWILAFQVSGTYYLKANLNLGNKTSRKLNESTDNIILCLCPFYEF